jgi:hypothetical protein
MERPAGRSERRDRMNEIDFIRQQLASERAHLREILEAVRAATPASPLPHPVTVYLDWARQRLPAQLLEHRAALASIPDVDPEILCGLARVAEASSRVSETDPEQPTRMADPLLALLDTWSEALDTLAGRTLRIAHWRKATHLSADSILQERQLYAAARSAAGLS